jgi:sn-glycerol 3-phosphate transport system permease protein
MTEPQLQPQKPSKILEYVLTYTALTIFAGFIVAPILILISASFKPSNEIFEYPPRLIPSTWTLENYAGALEKAPLLRYLLNTLLVALGVTFGQLVTSSLAAFAFARLNLPARNALFMGVIATYMVPWELTLIPNYLTISNLKLTDQFGALVLPFLAGAFGIFLLRQNFKQIPEEYFDAAKIDGATNLQQLWYVVFPLARPAFAALALLTFLNTWNQYLWPLIVTNSETWRTAQVGLRFFLVDQEGTNYGFVAAGAVIVLLPTLIAFVVLERSFVRGLSMGGLKG